MEMTAARMQKTSCTLSLPALAACALLSAPAHAQLADYTDQVEMSAALLSIDGALDGRVHVHQIGRGPDTLTPIYAVQIGELDSYGSLPADDPGKPGLLIECGTHAREWAAAESCLRFIDEFIAFWMLDDIAFGIFGIKEVLEEATVWVIPMVNPEGRLVDDPAGGDPYIFDTSNRASGWRKSNEAFTCATTGLTERGYDLNRTYSRGFNFTPPACSDRLYPGTAPFQAKESRIMRRFVNNHSISMSMSVHGNGQTFGTVFDGTAALGDMETHFVDEWNQLAPTELALVSGGGGSNAGQFTDWVARTSDNAAGNDDGTIRGAMSFLLEIPPNNTNYDTPGFAYRLADGDASHGFRPSHEDFPIDLTGPVFNAFMYLVRQARSAWRPIDPTTLAPEVTAACAANPADCIVDFGLTSSKIVASPSEIFCLTSPFLCGLEASTFGVRSLRAVVIADAAFNEGALGGIPTAADPRETLEPGYHSVIYRVQNFSEDTTITDVDVEVSFERRLAGTGGAFSTVQTDTRAFVLGSGDGAHATSATARHDFLAGYEYRVTVTATTSAADAVGANDRHVFRFSVE